MLLFKEKSQRLAKDQAQTRKAAEAMKIGLKSLYTSGIGKYTCKQYARIVGLFSAILGLFMGLMLTRIMKISGYISIPELAHAQLVGLAI